MSAGINFYSVMPPSSGAALLLHHETAKQDSSLKKLYFKYLFGTNLQRYRASQNLQGFPKQCRTSGFNPNQKKEKKKNNLQYTVDLIIRLTSKFLLPLRGIIMCV